MERDLRLIATGQAGHLFYSTVTGMRADLQGAQQSPRVLGEEAGSPAGSSDDEAEETGRTACPTAAAESATEDVASRKPGHSPRDDASEDEEEDEEEDDEDVTQKNGNDEWSRPTPVPQGAPARARAHGSADADAGKEESSKPKVPDLAGLSKEERKRAVKEFNRERRETKTPKHIKKRKDAASKQKRGTK